MLHQFFLLLSLQCLVSSVQIESIHNNDTLTERGLNIFEPEVDPIECTVHIVDGMPEPGLNEIAPQYICKTDDGNGIFFDESPLEAIGDSFESGTTRVAVQPLSSMMLEGRNDDHFQLLNSQKLTVIDSYYNDDDDNDNTEEEEERRRLTFNWGDKKMDNTEEEEARRRLAFNWGDKKMLVIKLESFISKADQSEWKLYNDFFDDENNVKKIYMECSNGGFRIQPATGPNVNRGVLTLVTSANLVDISWRAAASIVRTLAPSYEEVDRDHTVVVLPNDVNFSGAAAWAEMPGSHFWVKSQYAAAPIVQAHELGHNLGQGHSGYGDGYYNDPTCNMGNRAGWHDEGSKMCFNAAKTWNLGWYKQYHHQIDPRIASWEGTIVGINAVRENNIQASQKVVLKVSSNGERDLYIIYQRKVGANSQITDFGNTVVITDQMSPTRSQSYLKASLKEGEEYVQGGWSNAGALKIKVCDLSADGTGYARILVFATSRQNLSCESTPAPVQPPQQAPVQNPVQAPVQTPVQAPVQAPVKPPTPKVCNDFPYNWSDNYGDDCSWYGEKGRCNVYGAWQWKNGKTANDVCCACGGGKLGTPSPPSPTTKAPTKSPSSSPVRTTPTAFPTSSPTKAPVVSTDAPTKAPIVSTDAPTKLPTSSPTNRPTRSPNSGPCLDAKSKAIFYRNGAKIKKPCKWVARMPNARCKNIAGTKKHCPNTCKDHGGLDFCNQDSPLRFLIEGSWITCVNARKDPGLCAQKEFSTSCPYSCDWLYN